MSVDLMFQIVAAALLIGGAFVAWRFGWRDAGKGTRRCPKCWYEMTAGMKCPECGSEAKSERRLFRANRKWRWIACGLFLMAVSYPISRTQQVQKDGIVGLLPRLVILATWTDLADPRAKNAKDLGWWQISTPAVSRVVESTVGSEMSALETKAIAWSSVRAMRANNANARVAQEVLRMLGPEMGADGARTIVDAWLTGKLRNRGPGYGTAVFMELPESGRPFLDEVIAKVRANPVLLEREPYILEWVLVHRGSVEEIIEPLESVLATQDANVAGLFYSQLGTLPLSAEDAARTARMIRFEPKMGPMQLGITLARSGAASRFIADYREALTETTGNRVSSALVGAACAGPSLAALEPEIRAHLESNNEAVRFQAKVAMAMVRDHPEDVESEVFEAVRSESWESARGIGGKGGSVALQRSGSEMQAFERKRVAVAALCSGAWSDDDACEQLIEAARGIEANGLPWTRQQAIEFILMNAEQTRKHAAELNGAIRTNRMLAMIVGRRVRLYPAADAIAPGLEQAAEASTSQFQKRILRSQAAEARRVARERAASAAQP